MPSKIRSDDWERLFGPNAPRRGGPLSVLVTLLITFVVLAVVGAGAFYLMQYQQKRQADAQQVATLVAATVYPRATATAQAATATAQAELAAATSAAQPTVVAGIGNGTVTRGGNLRHEPVVADTNVVGLLWPGDEVLFLEQRDIDGQTWYRVQVVKPAADRAGDGVAAGSEGWASSLLLSPPQ